MRSWQPNHVSVTKRNALEQVSDSILAYRCLLTILGAKCGATVIDREFVRWMETQFGESYTSLSAKSRGPGSDFMRSFESQKMNFGDEDDHKEFYEVGPLIMKLNGPSIKYDEDDHTVKIPRSVFLHLYLTRSEIRDQRSNLC